MANAPRLLGVDPRAIGGLKDYYETTMLDANLAAGIAGRRSIFNLAVRGLRAHKVVGERVVTDADETWSQALVEPDNFLLNAGLEQVLAPKLAVVFGVATNVCVDCAVRGLRKRGVDVAVPVDAIKELPTLPLQATLDAWRAAGAQLTTVDDVIRR